MLFAQNVLSSDLYGRTIVKEFERINHMQLLTYKTIDDFLGARFPVEGQPVRSMKRNFKKQILDFGMRPARARLLQFVCSVLELGDDQAILDNIH